MNTGVGAIIQPLTQSSKRKCGLKSTNRLDEAEVLLRRALASYERSYGGNHMNVASVLSDLADLLLQKRDYASAESLYRRALTIWERNLGANHPHIASVRRSLALILKDRGDLDGAMVLHKEEERLCRELGNKDSLQASLGNQAVILKARGDLDGAMALFKEQERLCRELGNPEGLSISLANQARLLSGTPDRRREARQLAEQADTLDIIPGRETVTANRVSPVERRTPEVPTSRVHFSVSCPPAVKLGDKLIVDVWAHLERQRAEVERRVQQASHQVESPL